MGGGSGGWEVGRATVGAIDEVTAYHVTGYPLKLYFQIPCVFPVFSLSIKPQIILVPIDIICEYYIHKTELADLSIFWKKMEISAANIAISLTSRIREFTT